MSGVTVRISKGRGADRIESLSLMVMLENEV
jgi:hypothetical protein